MILMTSLLASAAESDKSTQPDSLYDLTATTIDGKQVKLEKFRGNVCVVVNTASRCGYTPQLADLEEIYQRYKSSGFTVLAFPSNDFGGQDPGSDQEIAQFCEGKFNTSFPLFAKDRVKGDSKQDVYKFLLDTGFDKSEVRWNFEKFIIDREGRVRERFQSATRPNSPEITELIEFLLKES